MRQSPRQTPRQSPLQSPRQGNPFVQAVWRGLSESLGFNGLSLGEMGSPSPNNSVQQPQRGASARPPSPWGASQQLYRSGLARPSSRSASLLPPFIGGGAASPPHAQAPQTPARQPADSRSSGSLALSVGTILDRWAADPATIAAVEAAGAVAAAARAVATAATGGFCRGEDSSSGEDWWEVEEDGGLPLADTGLVPPLQHVGPLRALPVQPPMARSRQPSGNGFPAAGTHLEEPPRSAGSQGRRGPPSIANLLAPATGPLTRRAAAQAAQGGPIRTKAGQRKKGF